MSTLDRALYLASRAARRTHESLTDACWASAKEVNAERHIDTARQRLSELNAAMDAIDAIAANSVAA